LYALAASQHYPLRNKEINFPGSEILTDVPKFFDRAGGIHPENLPRVGTAKLLPPPKQPGGWARFKQRAFKKYTIYDPTGKGKKNREQRRKQIEALRKRVPLDPVTQGARERRVADFQVKAMDIIRVDPADVNNHQLHEIIDLEREEIVQILKCTEIVGLPSSTDEVRVSGSIEVALVRMRATTQEPPAPIFVEETHGYGSKYMLPYDDGRGPRLIFSISQGVIDFSMNESFFHFACCFYICGPTFCDCCMSQGATVLNYQLESNVNRMLSTLPLRNTVVNVVANRETARQYMAGTDSGMDKSKYKLKQVYM
jgi:hypothetical protein